MITPTQSTSRSTRTTGASHPARRPNIVWLNADHYAYAHHRGLNPELIRTPTFDRLCAEGTRFDNAYTVCPLCTPARASLVTGQYPHGHGILNNDGKVRVTAVVFARRADL